MVDIESYKRLVGKPVYTFFIKPDMAYVVWVASQFMHNPKEIHFQATYSILHYLKSTSKGVLLEEAMD